METVHIYVSGRCVSTRLISCAKDETDISGKGRGIPYIFDLVML